MFLHLLNAINLEHFSFLRTTWSLHFDFKNTNSGSLFHGIFSSPEPIAHGELIVYQSRRRPSVRLSVRASLRASVRASTLLNINISETSGLFATKFYLKHHWDGGKAALCFGPDRIGTLVSTDSSHRVIMGKISLAL